MALKKKKTPQKPTIWFDTYYSVLEQDWEKMRGKEPGTAELREAEFLAAGEAKFCRFSDFKRENL